MTIQHFSTSKVGANFDDKRRSLGQYSSLTDSGLEFVFGVYDGKVKLSRNRPWRPTTKSIIKEIGQCKNLTGQKLVES
jgi:hypothetical protein